MLKVFGSECYESIEGTLALVEAMKWPQTNEHKPVEVRLAALIGLGAGLALGLVMGVIIAFCSIHTSGTELPPLRPAPIWAGAFFGSFIGLISGEITNAALTWPGAKAFNLDENNNDKRDANHTDYC